MRRRASAFLIMFAWDYIATISIKFIATSSFAAVPIAFVITALWWLGVGQVRDSNNDKIMFLMACLGAAVGTGVGILWP